MQGGMKYELQVGEVVESKDPMVDILAPKEPP